MTDAEDSGAAHPALVALGSEYGRAQQRLIDCRKHLDSTYKAYVKALRHRNGVVAGQAVLREGGRLTVVPMPEASRLVPWWREPDEGQSDE